MFVQMECGIVRVRVRRRFKALERIVTLQFQFKNYDAMTERYKELLSYATKVTRALLTAAR